MRKLMTWLYMLTKRQLKKPSLYVIVFAMLAGTLLIRHVAVNYEVDLCIGVMNEDDTNEEVKQSDTLVAEHILEKMLDHKGLIKFVEYDDEEEMKADVLRSKIYAGYIFTDDLWKKIRDDDMKDSVKVISTPDSIVTSITNELVFSYVMQEYTYDILLYDTYGTEYFEDEDDKQVEEDLRKYYQENLSNGSTFSITYTGAKEYDNHVALNVFDYISPIIKGLIAVLIFLAALCGTLTLYSDKESGAFARFTRTQTGLINLVEVFIPAFLTGIAGFVCMIITEQYIGTFAEVRHMMVYVILVTLYSFLLNELIRNKTLFLSLIPVFVMASLLFCHVFVNLNTVVPAFKYIGVLLPPNYF